MDNLKDHLGARRQYDKDHLDESNVVKDPFKLFEQWLKLAVDSGLPEPIAMNLATVSAQCRPSSRVVLLRGFDADGFVFYTNYKSRKGIELAANPFAALNFYWQEIDKQVRIEGSVEEVNSNMSDAYFNSRPRESQLGAWASAQSAILSGRNELNNRLEELKERYKDLPVPRPPHWGGYRVRPEKFEFWQGRPDRLHDRFQFTNTNNVWSIARLSP